MVRTIIALFGVAILFCFATVSDAEWTVLREDDIIRGDGIDGMLHDVYFTNNQNGLVVGDNGLMLVTTDGGKTWEKMEVDMRPPGARQRPGGRPGAGGGPPGFGGGGPSPLYNIYFVDENVGFITGGRATILKTEDGGKTWSRKMAMSDTPGRDGNPGRLRANLMGIQMINETIGFIAGSENTILKTTDGGETWIGSSERLASARLVTILRISGSFRLQRVGSSVHSGRSCIPLMVVKRGKSVILALITTFSVSIFLMKTPVGFLGRKA